MRVIKSFSLVVAAVVALTFVGTSSANATRLIFTNEAEFISAVSLSPIETLSFEGFETGFALGPITIGGTTISNSGTSSLSISTCCNGATEGTSVLFWGGSGFGPLTFTFSTPVNAFGIDIIGLGTAGDTTLTLTANGESNALFTDVRQGGVRAPTFIGIIDDLDGLSSLLFSNTSQPDSVQFDRMQLGVIAVIPLPAALPLYGTGLAVMGFIGWRRKRRAVG